MVPEIAFAMLACTRLGAPHSVVFAGFSAEALRDRIVDVKSKFVFTCNEGKRGGRTMALKQTVDDAITGIQSLPETEVVKVEKVFVFERTDATVNMVAGRDVDMKSELSKYRPYCPPVSMDSEDPLFFLYTSGSTGKPKGVAHTTAGYILYATLTHKYVFDIRPNDVYACVADCGWITGHTYIVYGPLSNGATTLMFESTPLYPDAGRYWDLVQTHKVTQFYTAPTAIRALMRFGTDPIQKYDLSSLRVLGTVGEPINPEAWRWYFENIGKKNCAVVDTYWQTETGGIIMTPLPGCTPMKPGSACKPFFGIVPELLNPHTGKVIPEVAGEESEGVLCIKEPWPSLARTVQGNHERYMNTYLDPYKGYYFTSDGATRDKDGYIWITGRVDDVLNVSGHRLGSAEIESALVANENVAEAAAIGFPHDVKGEGIACYVIARNGVEETPELLKELKNAVRAGVGPLATPDYIIITPGLPKTRSGKIMRRLLRKVISKAPSSEFGDVSTLADSSVVEELVAKVAIVRP
jgi:acetyl-CoA synthetase